MRIAVRILFAALLGVGAVACRHNAAAPGTEEATRSEKTTLKVENQGFADMDIFIIAGGQRIRLGMATGNQTTMFTIPSYLVRGNTPLRFLADPVGGNRTPVSDEITVTPGDQVTLTIPPS
ncbi:MAG TPA: hypothetical protein VFS44_15020 [Gemmatimonadaceae bacterium]|nr:hypothetical protein [Gemmatimonadaceae bacterium]